MSETDKIVYASERAETDETACEDLAAWEQGEPGKKKTKEIIGEKGTVFVTKAQNHGFVIEK